MLHALPSSPRWVREPRQGQCGGAIASLMGEEQQQFRLLSTSLTVSCSERCGDTDSAGRQGLYGRGQIVPILRANFVREFIQLHTERVDTLLVDSFVAPRPHLRGASRFSSLVMELRTVQPKL